MRKIRSQAEIDKVARRNQFIVGAVLIFLLLFSTLGYSLMSSDEESETSVNENGIEFYLINGFWRVEIDGVLFSFQNLPSEVADIGVNVSGGLERYSGRVLYFVNANEGAGEFLNNIGRYVSRYQEACLRGEECGDDLPLKDCESNLVVFDVGNETSVYQNESCIYVVGDSVKGIDAFLYDLLNVR